MKKKAMNYGRLVDGIDFSYDPTTQAGASGVRDVNPWGLGNEPLKIEEVEARCLPGSKFLRMDIYKSIFKDTITAYDSVESEATGVDEYTRYKCSIR